MIRPVQTYSPRTVHCTNRITVSQKIRADTFQSWHSHPCNASDKIISSCMICQLCFSVPWHTLHSPQHTSHPGNQSVMRLLACTLSHTHPELHTLKRPSIALFNWLYNFYTSLALKVHYIYLLVNFIYPINHSTQWACKYDNHYSQKHQQKQYDMLYFRFRSPVSGK